MLRRLLVVGAVLIAYGGVVIFAGHGSGPVALLMLFGSPSAWLSSQLLGWPGAPASMARSAPDQKLFFAPGLVETWQRLSVAAILPIVTLLLLDIAILSLLPTRPASLWLRGTQQD